MARGFLLIALVRRSALSALAGVCVAAGLVVLAGGSVPAIAPPGAPLVGKVITIDPGHGGIDPGSHDDQGTMEKEIVLEIARDVCYLLARARAIPVLTRHGDWEMSPIAPEESTRHRRDLAARIRIAHRTNADAFVSIHVNKVRSSAAQGAVVFHSRNNEESKRLAACIHQAIKDVAPHPGPSVLEGDYYVLNEAQLPAVIVEVGFISNPDEKELLLAPSYRGELAEAIYAGLVLFFEGTGAAPGQDTPGQAQGTKAPSHPTVGKRPVPL